MSREYPDDSRESHREAPSSEQEVVLDRRLDPEQNALSAPVSDRQREHTPDRPENPRPSGRTIFYVGDHGHSLNASQVRALAELGKFRVIAAFDLSHEVFGTPPGANSDLGELVRLALVSRRTFRGPEDAPRELLTLTPKAHRLLRANRLVSKEQQLYHGFVKPREANHDADLYRLYLKEAARIEDKGGRNLRVILDYELKRKINRDIARLGAEARSQIAELHGLRVVRNKIPIPDMRIEYETRNGDIARVNLELVTEHYRGRQVAEKVHAGFSLYTPHGEADHLRRVLDQRELTAEIFSL